MLIDSLLEEDRLLRQRCISCPKGLRETNGEGGVLSFKDTLGHVAFWDGFTVDFFTAKLDKTSFRPTAPVDFESQSDEALKALKALPFGEVLARYLESTGALVKFLKENWSDLSPKEKDSFWIPLKHRRHHRISLFNFLDKVQNSKDRGSSGGNTQALDRNQLKEMAWGA